MNCKFCGQYFSETADGFVGLTFHKIAWHGDIVDNKDPNKCQSLTELAYIHPRSMIK